MTLPILSMSVSKFYTALYTIRGDAEERKLAAISPTLKKTQLTITYVGGRVNRFTISEESTQIIKVNN
jgi:hypothetical protein